MKETILRRMIVLTLIAVVISSVASVIVVYDVHLDNTKAELLADAEFVLTLRDEIPSSSDLMELGAVKRNQNTRITVVGPGGRVLYDNWANVVEMENHSDREEIKVAFEQGKAESQRLSNTLGINTLYYAVLWDDGNVIRFAKETESFLSTLYRLLSLIILLIVAVTIVALWLGEKMANSIITPINNLDLDDPLGNDVYAELSPLLLRISRQNKDIKRQVAQLEKQQERFQTITTHMVEGLILLDDYARIVYMNPSAFRILGSPGSGISEFVGKSLLTFNRDLDVRKVVEQGINGKTDETMLTIDDQHYQLLVSPVSGEDEETHGVIIIVVNVTQKYEIERMRKEFSGNVSHELRTPLTAISSYAELLKNDMVQPEDVGEFAERIYYEAKRMTALVDDILKLSRLDERVDIAPQNNVDLRILAEEVAESLRPLAEARNVELVVTGETATVMGDAGMLFEMIYNLCDNAIKYNRDTGGRVEVNCRSEEDRVLLQVSDNGKGIAKEHQGRVFERFYRVDKSHSRKTGGTGLGLSIVKNVAAYHGATVKLESAENAGTKIEVEF
ncbi:MAG TPA: PAS domain-containing sensor histidine kinase [Firmicutes bacterium]|nr:PAS domain-containing sensor histidine kinase [Bacillota bacterium]